MIRTAWVEYRQIRFCEELKSKSGDNFSKFYHYFAVSPYQVKSDFCVFLRVFVTCTNVVCHPWSLRHDLDLNIPSCFSSSILSAPASFFSVWEAFHMKRSPLTLLIINKLFRTLSCTNVKFCKVLEIPFKVSENKMLVKNLLFGYHGNCLITCCFALIFVKIIMKNR